MDPKKRLIQEYSKRTFRQGRGERTIFLANTPNETGGCQSKCHVVKLKSNDIKWYYLSLSWFVVSREKTNWNFGNSVKMSAKDVRGREVWSHWFRKIWILLGLCGEFVVLTGFPVLANSRESTCIPRRQKVLLNHVFNGLTTPSAKDSRRFEP